LQTIGETTFCVAGLRRTLALDERRTEERPSVRVDSASEDTHEGQHIFLSKFLFIVVIVALVVAVLARRSTE
jgi:hypothetical protein